MASYQPQYPPQAVPLDLPYYGAPPVEAVKRFWQKYAVFWGRASRSEYWWWALASAIVSGILNAIGSNGNGANMGTSNALSGVWFLATVVPSLAVAARRLHDVNLSAWLLLLALVPILGWIALLIFMIMPPNPAGQRFDRPARAYPPPPYPQQPYPPQA